MVAFAVAVFGCSSSPSASTDAHTSDAAADTWTSYAAGFFVTYCNSCHNAQDTTGRDYSVQADVAKDKVAMRCGVAATQDSSWSCASSPVAKQFPIGSGPKPTDAERARIVAWITAGEP
ncbi:MAG TPA: hypothetical protein VF403_12020 [Kofleriaceae bacterium]